MTRDAERMHRRNLGRLDRQLSIAGDDARDMQARKRAARHAASLGEKLGLIERPPRCEWCARRRGDLERHHPRYDMPLHVMFLCPTCHIEANLMDGTAEHRPRRAS